MSITKYIKHYHCSLRACVISGVCVRSFNFKRHSYKNPFVPCMLVFVSACLCLVYVSVVSYGVCVGCSLWRTDTHSNTKHTDTVMSTAIIIRENYTIQCNHMCRCHLRHRTHLWSKVLVLQRLLKVHNTTTNPIIKSIIHQANHTFSNQHNKI